MPSEQHNCVHEVNTSYGSPAPAALPVRTLPGNRLILKFESQGFDED